MVRVRGGVRLVGNTRPSLPPARLTPFEIGNDYVLDLRADADEIEQIHLYRVRKPQ